MRLPALWLTFTLLAAANSAAPRKAAEPSSPPVSARKGTGQPAPKAQAPARKSTTAKKTASSKTRKQPARQRGWRAGQQAPTRERYAEIQQALVERGYLDAQPAGLWGPEWVEALKRFQQEHNLEPSGKLNSLTLIALGLGPNRNSRSALPTGGADGQPPSQPPQ